MPTQSGPGNASAGAPYAECEYVDYVAQITLAATTGVLKQGQTVCRDITQISGVAGQTGTSNQQTLPDCVVLPSSANAGRNYGVYQGPTISNTAASAQTYLLLFRRQGLGLVLASVVETSGTAVTTGSKLISQPTSSDEVIVGTPAIGTSVGMPVATPINTYSASAVATGSHAVTPVNGVGITTSTALLIDGGTALAETVTPSAIATSGLTFTATFANAHAAGFTITGSATAVGATLVKVPTATGDLAWLVYCDIFI